ncbi:MAG: SBBP repeat-containing protein [Ignavibacteria bacterium]|nr:SBBP repeat-containing protein [Ignavibacteria bacterium]
MKSPRMIFELWLPRIAVVTCLTAPSLAGAQPGSASESPRESVNTAQSAQSAAGMNGELQPSARQLSGSGGKAEAWLRSSGILFRENRGQISDGEGNARPDIAFTADVPGARLYFRRDGISTVFARSSDSGKTEVPGLLRGHGPRPDAGPGIETYRMDMSFIGANASVRIRAEEAADGVVNCYLPGCPDGITGIREFRRIVYENIYDRIDLEMFSRDGRLKYNFIVHPGGRANDIRMRYHAATRLSILQDGALSITTPLGEVREDAPVSYLDDAADPVETQYRVSDEIVSFNVSPYDLNRTLTIDPWATYYGGNGHDNGYGVATDANANVFLSGHTYSTDFPVSAGFQMNHHGYMDAFIVKFNPNGVRLWATLGWKRSRRCVLPHE